MPLSILMARDHGRIHHKAYAKVARTRVRGQTTLESKHDTGGSTKHKQAFLISMFSITPYPQDFSVSQLSPCRI